jgi:hypothetical protein
MNIKKPDDLIDQVDEVIGRWPNYAEEQRVEPELMEAIASTFVRMR